MPSETVSFDFFITPATSWPSGQTVKRPVGSVNSLVAAWNKAITIEVEFHDQDINKQPLDLTEVNRNDRLEIKMTRNGTLTVPFVGLIYERLVSTTDGRRVIKIKGYGYGRLLGERQLNRIIHNGFTDKYEVDIADDYTFDVQSSSVRPMRSVEVFNLANQPNADVRNVAYYSFIDSNLPGGARIYVNIGVSGTALESSEAAVIFTPKGALIKRVWVLLRDPEDELVQFLSKALPNSTAIRDPIIISLTNVETRETPGGDIEVPVQRVPEIYNGTVQFQNEGYLKRSDPLGSPATYRISNRLKEGWGPGSAGFKTGAFGAVLGWFAFGATGGNTIELIQGVGIGLPSAVGDNRTGSHLEIGWSGGGSPVGIYSTNVGSNLNPDINGNPSASGRVSFKVRSLDFTTSNLKVSLFLRDRDDTIEIQVAQVEFQPSTDIILHHGDGQTSLLDTATLPVVVIGSYFFEFDLHNLTFQLSFWEANTNTVLPIHLGRFKIQNQSSFTGNDVSAPATFNRIRFESDSGSVGIWAIGWINFNEIGNVGLTSRELYLYQIMTPDTIYDDDEQAIKLINNLSVSATGFQIGETVKDEVTPGNSVIRLVYGSILNGPFVGGSTVTGGTTGATGVIVGVRPTYIVVDTNESPAFQNGEIITGSTAGPPNAVLTEDPRIYWLGKVLSEGVIASSVDMVNISNDGNLSSLGSPSSGTAPLSSGTIIGLSSGFTTAMTNVAADVRRNTEKGAFTWCLADFSDAPVVIGSIDRVALHIRMPLNFGRSAGIDDYIEWGAVLSGHQTLSKDVSAAAGIMDEWSQEWGSLNDKQLIFMVEYDNSWVNQVENRDFTVDYDNLKVTLQSRVATPTSRIRRFDMTSSKYLCRYSQYTNTDSGGFVRSDRKMRLRDVIVEMLKSTDDPLNPGNPIDLLIDGNLDGFDDELGTDIDGIGGGTPGTGFDTIQYIYDTFIIKQRSIADALRDLAIQNVAVWHLKTNAMATKLFLIFEKSTLRSDAVDFTTTVLPSNQYVVSRDRITNLSNDEYAIVLDIELGLDQSEVFTRLKVKGASKDIIASYINVQLEADLGRIAEIKPEVFSKETSIDNLYKYIESLSELYGVENRNGKIEVAGIFPRRDDGSFNTNALIRVVDPLMENGLDVSGSNNVYKVESIIYDGQSDRSTIYLTNRLITKDLLEEELQSQRDLMNGIEPEDAGSLEEIDLVNTILLPTVVNPTLWVALYNGSTEITSEGYTRMLAFRYIQSNQNYETYSVLFDEGNGTITSDALPITHIGLAQAPNSPIKFNPDGSVPLRQLVKYTPGPEGRLRSGDVILAGNSSVPWVVGTIISEFEDISSSDRYIVYDVYWKSTKPNFINGDTIVTFSLSRTKTGTITSVPTSPIVGPTIPLETPIYKWSQVALQIILHQRNS